MTSNGNGVLKNFDAVSTVLGKIEEQLTAIDQLMGSFGSKSGSAAQKMSTAIGGIGTKPPVSGSGKTNGSATSIFTTLSESLQEEKKENGGGAKFTTTETATKSIHGTEPAKASTGGGGNLIANSLGKFSGGGGGGGTPTGPGGMPLFEPELSPVQRFGANHPMLTGGLQIGLAAGSAAWDILPGVDAARMQRQPLFRATFGWQGGGPDYKTLAADVNEAFGGVATSAGSQSRVLSTMAQYGQTLRPGAAASSDNIKNALSEIGTMSLMTGRSNEEMEAVRRSLGKGSKANKLFMYGINTVNKDGTQKDFGATVKQVMDRSFQGEYSLKDVERGLAEGGILRSNLTQLLGAENAEVAADYARAIASTGAQDGVLDERQKEMLGLTDTQRNTNYAEQRTIAEREMTTAEYADELITGWDKALEAARAVDDILQRLGGILGPIAAAKGFGQGLSSAPATSALIGGLSGFGAGIGTLLGGFGSLGGGFGGGLAGGRFGGGGGRPGGGGGFFGFGSKGSPKGAPAQKIKVTRGQRPIGARAVPKAAGPSGLLGGAAASSAGKAAAKTGMRGALGGAARVAGRVAGPLGVGLLAGDISNMAMNAVGSTDASTEGEKQAAVAAKIGLNTATGAAAGAAIGSVVPVVGTAAGAVVGGAAGLLLGALRANEEGLEYGQKPALGDTGSFWDWIGFGADGSATGARSNTAKDTKNTQGTVAGALAFARAEAKKGNQPRWRAYCARFVANCWGRSNSGYASASVQWRSIPKQFKYPGSRDAPAGALLFWTGGSSGHGHVVLSMGGGMVATNDIDGPGKISIVPLTRVMRWVSRQKFEGWSQPYYGGKVIANVGTGGAGAYVEPDTGGKSTGARGMTTTGGASGMDSASTVVPMGGSLITASAYTGVTATPFSIKSEVETSLGALMSNAAGAGVFQQGSRSMRDDRNQQAPDTGQTSVGTGFSDSSDPGEGDSVSRWTNVAANALKAHGLSLDYLPDLMRRLKQESSGNPRAINKWDSNAKKGTPSKGLMQVIDPTFDMVAGPYKSRGVWDPFANIYAGIGWTLHKYGESGIKKAWAGTKGYSEGSWRIPKDEIAKIHQGEMILPAAAAEAVRTSVRKAAAGQVESGGARSVEINVHMTGNMNYDVHEFYRRVKTVMEQDADFEKIGKA